jgi:hypothetical protein
MIQLIVYKSKLSFKKFNFRQLIYFQLTFYKNLILMSKENLINNANRPYIKSWSLYDEKNPKEDGDQLKTVIGICFMIITLSCVGAVSIFY